MLGGGGGGKGLWILYTIQNVICMYLLLWHIFDCVLFRFVNALVALWRILPVGLLNVCVAIGDDCFVIGTAYFCCDVFLGYMLCKAL